MLRFSKIAWRNVVRNKRRSLITLAAISSGLASIIVFFGLSNGFHAQWIRNSVKAYSGHVVIYAVDYRETRNLNRNIGNLGRLEDLSAQFESLETFAPRIHFNGLLSAPRSSTTAVIRGVDPQRERRITGIDTRIIDGNYFDGEGRKQILLGYKLAKRLNAEPGEKIVMMMQAADGSIGAELFRLKGIFRLGAIDLDSGLAIVSIADAQEIAVLGDSVTEGVLILKTPDDVPRVAAALNPELESLGYEALTWDQVLPQAREMIALSDVFIYVLLVIVLIVVALGILNTMLMSIMERTREFGIMRALGTRPGQLIKLVMLESVMLGLLGVGCGVLLGITINTALAVNGLDLSRWSGAMDLVSSLEPVIYPATHPENVAVAAVAAFVTTLLASVYPAIRAARLKPVAAIRAN